MVILAILAALGVVSMSGFVDRAKQSARESVAQTIFMAGQTALTQAYNQDRDFYINNRSPIIPTGDFLPGDESEKLNHNPPALVYLKMDKGGANTALPLYTMLSPYLNDKSVLGESILIEYNRETGKMLSVFYSDEPGVTFGYGSSNSYDVRNRDDSQLKAGKVGYFGVESTGEVIRPDPLDEEDYSVLLVDQTDPTQMGYGLLTAEIKIKADIWNSVTANTMLFHLSLLPMGRGEVENLTFTKDLDGYDFKASDLMTIDSIKRAIESPRQITVDEETRSIPVYLKDYTAISDYCTIVVIIDGVQSIGSTTSISIRDTFPGLQDGFLYAELEAVDNSESVSVYSDDKSNLAVHTLYGYDSAADNSSLTVMSVRHLNNIRYNAAGNFEQTQSIYMWDYRGNTDGGNGHPLNFKPLCNRLDPKAEGSSRYGFTGSYTSSATYAIIDFQSDLTVQTNIPHEASDRDIDDETLLDAGLFDTILSGGSVSNVRFAVSQAINAEQKLVTLFVGADTQPAREGEAIALVKGVRTAGGIAAVNGGTIENCTMLGYVGAKYADGISDGTAGAIAGKNTGTITRCASLCTVHGEEAVGGIAGTSSGEVSYCEAGTASWRRWPGGDKLYRSGTPAYGASDTQNGVYRGGYETANNTHRLIIMDSDGIVGGIVGRVSGARATVIGCVNACKVESGNIEGNGLTNTSGNIAGGIVGQLDVTNNNFTAVGYCYNAGEVDAASRSGNSSGGAGGIVGEVEAGRIANCYNTGTVNLQTKEISYDVDFMKYNVIDRTLNLNDAPPDSAGGLIGHGTDSTVIEYCYSAQYTGNAFGGAFGELAMGAQVINCGFLRNIRNTESAYYTGQYDSHNDPIMRVDGIDRYEPEELRRAKTVGKLSTAFTDGSFQNPAGVFKYPYPYLSSVPLEGNLPGHRTPYSPTIASYGDVSLTGSMKEGDYIYCSFYSAPPEGYINIYAASAYTEGPNFLCCIPLLKAWGFNSLTDVRNTADTSWEDLGDTGFIYGYHEQYSEGKNWAELTPDYTFRIKAHELKASDQNEAKYIEMGYSYQYTIRMTYGTVPKEDTRETNILSNRYTYIRANLYNTAEGVHNNSNSVDDDDIGRCELSMIDPVDQSNSALLHTTARALVISGMPLDETKSIELELNYTDSSAQDQTISLPAEPLFLPNAPRTFEEAMDSDKKYDGSCLSNPNGTTNGFKYYVQNNSDGTKSLYLLLWVEPQDTKYNGLYEIFADKPVTITARRGTQSTAPMTVCEKKFYSWEALQ